jgi:large subunit ribosomal protein L24
MKSLDKNEKIKTSLKIGDVVQVVSGSKKNVGQKGKLVSIDFDTGRVKVEGVAPIKRHVKPQKFAKHPEGGIIEDFGSIHISNVMLFSEADSRPVRIGYKFDGDNKVRVARGKNLKGTSL